MDISLNELLSAGRDDDDCNCDHCRHLRGEDIVHPLPEAMVETLKELCEAYQAQPPAIRSLVTPRKGLGYPNEGLPAIVVDVVEHPEDIEKRQAVRVIMYAQGEYREHEFFAWELEPYVAPAEVTAHA